MEKRNYEKPRPTVDCLMLDMYDLNVEPIIGLDPKGVRMLKRLLEEFGFKWINYGYSQSFGCRGK